MSNLSVIKSEIKFVCSNVKDKRFVRKARKAEIIKYEDEQRKNIYEKVTLSEKQKKEIDTFFLDNYGEKIPYIWHRHFTAFTGNFDVKYFPELLFIPEFEYYMNPYSEYARVFSDKNVLPYIANAVGIKMPKTIVSNCCGVLRNSNNRAISKEMARELLKNEQIFFAKPTIDSCSGQNCMLLDLRECSEKEADTQIDKLFEVLGNDFVAQERIICHESISKIYPDSVNTFRIMTYRWKNSVQYVPIIMRIGRGGAHVDNAHAGGMFIAVDSDGTMHEKAFTEFRDVFTEHPDTHVVFASQKISLLPTVIDAAISMHYAMPQIGVINWDFTIDENKNPVLIEANINGGSIWLFEMAHGVGAFGENTGDILKWLKKMKKMSPKQRMKHLFGN